MFGEKVAFFSRYWPFAGFFFWLGGGWGGGGQCHFQNLLFFGGLSIFSIFFVGYCKNPG